MKVEAPSVLFPGPACVKCVDRVPGGFSATLCSVFQGDFCWTTHLLLLVFLVTAYSTEYCHYILIRTESQHASLLPFDNFLCDFVARIVLFSIHREKKCVSHITGIYGQDLDTLSSATSSIPPAQRHWHFYKTQTLVAYAGCLFGKY